MDEDQALERTPPEATPHLRADTGYLEASVPDEAYEIVVPGTGEVVLASDTNACVLALAAVRAFEDELKQAKAALSDAIIYHAGVRGSKTITLPTGQKAVVAGDSETSYDAETIEHELREAGMPEDRIREIVKEEITHTVVANEAKKAAGANPVYAEIIERNRTKRPKTPYVSLKGFGS